MFLLSGAIFIFNSLETNHVVVEIDILVMTQKEKRLHGSDVNVGTHVENSWESKSRGTKTTKKKLEEKIPGFFLLLKNA